MPNLLAAFYGCKNLSWHVAAQPHVFSCLRCKSELGRGVYSHAQCNSLHHTIQLFIKNFNLL